MYSLLVQGQEWEEGPNTFSYDRFLEGTEANVRQIAEVNGGPNVALLESSPVLFVQEDYGDRQAVAKVGRISHLRRASGSLIFEVSFERNAPGISRIELGRLYAQLHISIPNRGLSELNRTHWAVKDVDLYRVLFTQVRVAARTPSQFNIPLQPIVSPTQLSAMMPFGQGFTEVYRAIQTAATENVMVCNRADDIWVNPAIIDDVAALIDSSSIIVVDCTGKNPNVFYELGLAHAWGKEVIIITQSAADIPFDLQHIRYIQYLNNNEGRDDLARKLSSRIRSLRE